MGKSFTKQFLLALSIAALPLSITAQTPGEPAVNGAGTGTIPLINNPASGIVTAPPLDTPTPTAKPKKAKKKAAAKPGEKHTSFQGKLSAVDKTAMTITVDGTEKRVLKITSKTHINKDGKPALFADGKIGDAVSGLDVKSTDGSEEALVVNFGVRPAATKPRTHKPKTPKTAPDGLAPATDSNLPAPIPATPVESSAAPVKSP